MKRVVGMKTTNTSERNFGAGPSTSTLGGSRIGTHNYYRLDNLKPSESAEYLHGGMRDPGITCTTRIAVVPDSGGPFGDDKFLYPSNAGGCGDQNVRLAV
jgi:hypothetical protein